MEIRKDMLGREPNIGDTIAFNPPKYKGLVFGEVSSFSKAGLPEIDVENGDHFYFESILYFRRTLDGKYSPKTGFVIAKRKSDGD